MAFWEFLIQKEGDRSWLPLDSPTVEILEGRYRVVARASRINTSVEIRVVHNAITENPPVRRIQKRSSKTNRDGLLVILPFTRFLPGSWELRCTGDLMTDMMGEGWSYAVQLQVLPLEQEGEDDWEPDWEDTVQHATDSYLEDAQPSSPSARPILTVSSATTEEAVLPSLVAPVAGTPADAVPSNAAQTDVAQTNIAQTDSSQADRPHLDPATPGSAAPPSTTSTPATALGTPLEVSGIEQFQKLTAAGTQAHSLRLSLDQTNYIVQRGQPLRLTGQVESSAVQDEIAIAPSTLRVRLFDPQTSNMLVDETQNLAVAGLPCPVSVAVALPAKCETYLLLGELVLYGIAPEGSLPPVLASQSFTVATDLLDLLETLANAFSESDVLPAPEQAPPKSVAPANTAVLPLPRMAQPLQFRPAIQQPLPPQLRPVDSNPNKVRRSLDLPSFNPMGLTPTDTAAGEEEIPDRTAEVGVTAVDAATSSTAEVSSHSIAESSAPTASLSQGMSPQITSPEITSPEVTPPKAAEIGASPSPLAAALSATDAVVNPSPIDIPELTEMPELEMSPRNGELRSAQGLDRAAPVEPPAESADAAETLDTETPSRYLTQREDWVDPSVDWGSVERPVPLWQRQTVATAEPAKVEDAAFHALNLEERFLARLQALATDAELANWLNKLEKAPTQEVETNGETAALFAQRAQPVGLDADLAAQEIVVEDEPVSEAVTAEAPEESPSSGLTPIQTAIALAEEPLIAPPQLEIPAGELVAGQTITVSVKLLDTYARVYTKLWMHDRQSRTLLDGPHWLMDFVPDGLGNQITRAQIMVPFGCLEVQFEAIAIDMATQQESDKAIEVRTVVPPDLSVVTIDELGV